MNLLLCNDDGVTARGLTVLHQNLQRLGRCSVYAPDRNCTAASSALTLNRPLRPSRQSNGFYAIDGTPVDCVHLAVNALLENKPDIVISGINHGANLGDDVLYSGTVAAALEGRFMRYPAIAVSLCGDSEAGFAAAGQVVVELVRKLDQLKLPPGSVLNVNVPNRAYDDIKGIKVTRLGHRERPDAPLKVVDPRGREAWWIAPVGKEQDAGEGTDFHAITTGYVSITPLQYDQTDHNTLTQVQHWLGD
ncbi:stationary phase survival protein SurE [Endozoicomonas montiporae]|uniref:5'-nucleotidase SurE n=2 Tax=Endozoicomonas montiporae TaxID=1027273 RepID=A0A081NBQ0_9GAMM|nr:5'/3'-nucleotidase SurE [Endozoicomonas montiporae]AMO56170.1 stationary-phase survival protein SurE [Endozoicomonas montiporae CL-33]KEQ15873.1 stationary phase survival protein SurE [Endozoicomonas montiporae]